MIKKVFSLILSLVIFLISLFGCQRIGNSSDSTPYMIGDFINLGTQIYNSQAYTATIGNDKDGNPTAYVLFDGIEKHDSQLTPINLDTFELGSSTPISSAPGGFTSVITTDGKVCVGTYNNGCVTFYNPVTNEIENTIKIPGAIYIYGLTAGPNGSVYCGVYPKNELYFIDKDGTTKAVYSKNNDANGQFVFYSEYISELNCVVLGSAPKAELMILDLKTNKVTDILPDKYKSYQKIQNIIYSGGKLLVQIIDKQFTILEYDMKLSGGKAVATLKKETSSKSVSIPFAKDTNGNLFYSENSILTMLNPKDNKVTNLKEHLSFALCSAVVKLKNQTDYPGNTLVTIYSSGNLIEFNYVNIDTGKTLKKEINADKSPTKISGIYKGQDGKIYISGTNSSNIAIMENEKLWETISNVGTSNNIFATKSDIYIATTPKSAVKSISVKDVKSKTAETLFDLTEKQQNNPLALTLINNKLIVGTLPERGKIGGAITIYDLKKKSVDVIENPADQLSFTSVLSTNNKLYFGTAAYDSSGLIEKAASIVSTDLNGGNVVIINTPQPVKTINAITAEQKGFIWGIADNYIFKYDIKKNEFPVFKQIFNYNNNLNSPQICSILFGKDNFIYATVEKTLWRIDPKTIEKTSVYENSDHLVKDNSNNLYFSVDSDLFIFKAKK